jgi:hypothetical protein
MIKAFSTHKSSPVGAIKRHPHVDSDGFDTEFDEYSDADLALVTELKIPGGVPLKGPLPHQWQGKLKPTRQNLNKRRRIAAATQRAARS